MPHKKSAATPYTKLHNDGSIWAKGQTLNGVLTGYWEWFRKGGVRMRSGYFENGEQAGEWITYDKTGAIVKVTDMNKKKKK